MESVNETILGYIIDKDNFDKAMRLCDRLHGGNDASRNEGHRLWLILREAELHPITEGGVSQ